MNDSQLRVKVKRVSNPWSLLKYSKCKTKKFLTTDPETISLPTHSLTHLRNAYQMLGEAF